MTFSYSDASGGQPDQHPDEVNPDDGDTVDPVAPEEYPPGREDTDEPNPGQPGIQPAIPETPPQTD